MKLKNHKKTIIATFFHAFILLFLTLYWLNLPHIYSDEAFFIKWTSLIKKTILNIDPKPNPNEVLFVDVSGNKMTIPQLNEFEELSDYNRKVIVDRSHLQEFLALIVPNKEDVKHIFIDLIFEYSSPHDTIFLETAKLLNDKLTVVSRIDETGKYQKPIFDLNNSLATYESSQNIFLKYPLFYKDSLQNISLSLLEKIDNIPVERKGKFIWIDNNLSLPSPIVDFKVRPIDFKIGTSLEDNHFSILQLGTLLELSHFMEAEDVAEYFKNKLIILGDFKNDKHETCFGNMPGPLIVYNAYLTLKEGAYRISFGWILFLFIGFWFLTLLAYTPFQIPWPSFLRQPQIEWVKETINESFILIILTVFSYFLFNIHINILILLVYITITSFLWKRFLQVISTQKTNK